jgi:branched-chain amino acid transport system permease protein
MRAERETAGLAALLAIAVALAAVLDDSALGVYVLITLAAIVTVGISLLIGSSGQVSLGHGAFYACGAYAAGVLTTHGYPSLLGLLVAPIAAAGMAAVIGIPLLLLRGHHLAFATLAVHLIVLSLVGEMAIMGGDVGLQGIPRLQTFGFEFDSVRSYAYLSVFLLAGVVVVTRNILSSRAGRAIRALSSSEVAAASSGIAVGRYKLAVFALSAAFAGLAGGVYAFHIGYLAPGSFPILLSVEYLVMAAIGGVGRIWGALVGSATVFLLIHGLSRLATTSGMPSSAPVIFSYAVYAVLLITAVLFLPSGLAGSIELLADKLQHRLGRSEARNPKTAPLASSAMPGSQGSGSKEQRSPS